MTESISRVLADDVQIVEESQQQGWQKNSFQTAESDPGFLAAKGKFRGNRQSRAIARDRHIYKLAGAIIQAMKNHGYAKIRAIGSDAKSNAVDAIQQASEECRKEKGIDLFWGVRKETGNIGSLRDDGHVPDVEATVFSLGTFTKGEE